MPGINDLKPCHRPPVDVQRDVARLTYDADEYHATTDCGVQYVPWRSADWANTIRVGDFLGELCVVCVPISYDAPLLVWDPVSRQMLEVHVVEQYTSNHCQSDLALELQQVKEALTALKCLVPLLQEIRDNAGAGVDWALMEETERVLNSF